MFAEIAIPVAVNQLFTYSIPSELRDIARVGMRVTVPFGKRTVAGIIIKLNPSTALRVVKPIADIPDPTPILSGELTQLCGWISSYYLAPIGEVIKAALVQGATAPGKRTVRLASEGPSKPAAGSIQKEIVRLLMESGRLTIADLQRKLRTKSIAKPLAQLVDGGIICIEDARPTGGQKPKTENAIPIDDQSNRRWHQWMGETDSRQAKRLIRQIQVVRTLIDAPAPSISVTELLRRSGASLSTIRTLEKNGLISLIRREVIRKSEFDYHEASLGALNIIPNQAQQHALDELKLAFDQGTFKTMLLHGVTGSGKTQVYIEAIRDVLARGKTAIVLVPEIALTPQIVRRFAHHFGEKVVAMHSRMSIGERYDAWRLTREGVYSIVIGPRSAVFAPLNNLGLIVVDEEHEPSYKQFDQVPRYHARDVAIMRASLNQAIALLGSATPSFESYTNAINGKYAHLELPERIDAARLPRVDIVDMTKEHRRKLETFRTERKALYKSDPAEAAGRKFEASSISEELCSRIADRLGRREGIILLQNRRGFAPFVECPECGNVEMCDHCNISLTFHQSKNQLRCHYCGFVKQPPQACPECRSPEIKYRGFGTQRIEEEIVRLFPHAKVARMDLDTTTKRGAHDAILTAFGDGEIDILLGTQMVAKGLDFPRVTLVGVISADTQMLLPDFRSAERTFQLLTQVAGRAGRSSLAGEVIIQTAQPRHYSLRHVATHDFKGFYEEENLFRSELSYPPYSRMALIEFKGTRETEVMQHATIVADLLRGAKQDFLILGPAPAAITRIKNAYRWHVALKSLKSKDPSGSRLRAAIERAREAYGLRKEGRSRSVRMIIDIDPQGMM